jgi:hypothetical protein
MNPAYARQLDQIFGRNRFQYEAPDWNRFYAFLVAVHQGDRAARPLESEIEEHMTRSMPHANEWLDELMIAYRRGLALLDYDHAVRRTSSERKAS